jgi:hypothetical protein
LIVIPAIYALVKGAELGRAGRGWTQNIENNPMHSRQGFDLK